MSIFSLGDEKSPSQKTTQRIEDGVVIPAVEVYPTANGFLVKWSVSNVYMLANAQIKLERYIHSSHNEPEEVVDVTGKMFHHFKYIQRYPFKQFNQWVRLTVTKNNISKSTPFVPVMNVEDATYNTLKSALDAFIQGRSSVVAFVYKLRYGGEVCDRCFNPTLLKPTDPFCPTCLGTGFKGGYLEPIKTRAILVSAPQKVLIRRMYLDSPSSWVLRMSYELPVSTNDVVFLPHGAAWLTVSHVVEQRFGAIPISQIVTLAQEDEDSILARSLVVPEYGIEEKSIKASIVPKMPDQEG